MTGIQEEFMVFLAAVLSGGIIRLVYRCISCFRQIVRHNLTVIGIEDLIFWDRDGCLCVCANLPYQ